MILTEDFIALNNPKTGSTFVRTILKILYDHPSDHQLLRKLQYKVGMKQPALRELILPSIKNYRKKPNQHGTYSQIPNTHSEKPVFSVVRNPYEKLLSAYEYKFWAKAPRIPMDTLSKHFPHFPDLSMDEFIDMVLLADQETNLNKNESIIGSQTEQFIYMFFKEPKKVLGNLSTRYFETKAYLDDLGKVEFLTQENLNTELITYLGRYGFSSEQLEVINRHEKVNENKSRKKDRSAMMTDKFFQYIDNKEKYLLMMYRDLGIHYERPAGY
ncbi:MAG: sulfotransferase family 2 domain-containing protein [Bacteroidota bacterium]